MKIALTLISVFTAAIAVLCVGCGGDGTITPSPSPIVSPIVSPSADLGNSPDTIMPGGSDNGILPDTSTSPNVSTSPDAGASPGTGTLEGFEEGKTVDESTIPTVQSAIKEKYPDATIKGVSYATYLNEQVYLVMLEGAPDNTDRVYVKADGTIVPYAAASGENTTSGS